MIITVDSENLNELDEIIGRAREHGFKEIMLSPMTPLNGTLYGKSIFVNFEECKGKINGVIKWWHGKGMHVTVLGHSERMQDRMESCPYSDNWLNFHGKDKSPNICCGAIEMPLAPDGLDNDVARERHACYGSGA